MMPGHFVIRTLFHKLHISSGLVFVVAKPWICVGLVDVFLGHVVGGVVEDSNVLDLLQEQNKNGLQQDQFLKNLK